jgi:putative transposase
VVMDEHVYKSHNKTLLMYHLVFPAKYRRKVFTSEVEASLKEICLGIEARYEMRFIEIGLEEDHVDLLVQGLPTMAMNEIVRIIKSLTAREIFKRHPKIRKEILWGRRVVDEWVLCEHRRIVCRERDHQTV